MLGTVITVMFGDFCFVFFFFQAEDGIRDGRVTGVQTCALPICAYPAVRRVPGAGQARRSPGGENRHQRSEERRVGKEGRIRGGAGHLKKKKKEGVVSGRVREKEKKKSGENAKKRRGVRGGRGTG